MVQKSFRPSPRDGDQVELAKQAPTKKLNESPLLTPIWQDVPTQYCKQEGGRTNHFSCRTAHSSSGQFGDSNHHLRALEENRLFCLPVQRSREFVAWCSSQEPHYRDGRAYCLRHRATLTDAGLAGSTRRDETLPQSAHLNIASSSGATRLDWRLSVSWAVQRLHSQRLNGVSWIANQPTSQPASQLVVELAARHTSRSPHLEFWASSHPPLLIVPPKTNSPSVGGLDSVVCRHNQLWAFECRRALNEFISLNYSCCVLNSRLHQTRLLNSYRILTSRNNCPGNWVGSLVESWWSLELNVCCFYHPTRNIPPLDGSRKEAMDYSVNSFEANYWRNMSSPAHK